MKDVGYKLSVLCRMLFHPPVYGVGATMIMEGYSDWEVDEMEAFMWRNRMEDLKKLLLSAPDGQLDACMKPLIEKWDTPPKAVQVLEVLDQCIFASLASGFTVRLLQMLYDASLTNEKTTNDEVVKLATWRK